MLPKCLMQSMVVVLILVLGVLSYASVATVNDAPEAVTIEQRGLTLTVIKKGFRYSFSRSDGIVNTVPHEVSGIQMGQREALEPVTESRYIGSSSGTHRFHVKTDGGLTAEVSVKLDTCHAWFDIKPDTDQPLAIVARIGGASPGYGLGDLQAYHIRPTARSGARIAEGLGTDITGFDGDFLHAEIPLVRCVSNFTIYPRHGFATINIEPWAKIVRSTAEQVAQGSSETRHMTDMHYFFGTPREIYAHYLRIRNLRGYPVMLPKYEFFGVGWEAWGALGWNTDHRTVRADVDRYLESGYPLRWMVLGSGFWPADISSRSRLYLATRSLGATTSFGLWDENKYPDPEGFIRYFQDKGMKFFIGLRICFIVDGPYSQEGVERGYFLKDSSQRAKIFRISFPTEPVYLLDTQNPDAITWYVDLCKKWKVDGFKEDLYGYNNYYLRDDKLNPVNERLMQEGYYVMGRNNYLGSAADLQRYEDFNYNQDQDRGPVNSLASAYAGMPLVYPDVIGGNFGGRSFDSEVSERVKEYLKRNALWLSLHPSMAVGKGPWHYNDTSVEDTMLRAALLHDRLHPYFYSQAVRFYHDGYPWPMCPLPIAYPDDERVHGRENNVVRGYQWMIGDAVMAIPLYGDDYQTAQSRDVYLPEGDWIDYDTGRRYTGPRMLKEFPLPAEKTPVFVGGTGIVIEKDKDGLVCRLYPVADNAETVLYAADGVTESRITIARPDWDNPVIVDLTDGKTITATMVRHAWQFDWVAGRSYSVR